MQCKSRVHGSQAHSSPFASGTEIVDPGDHYECFEGCRLSLLSRMHPVTRSGHDPVDQVASLLAFLFPQGGIRTKMGPSHGEARSVDITPLS
jgi:hypothetical protein